jgi:hypothetical protein
MKQGTYEIVEYQIEVEGIIQNRKRIIYYTNQDELYLIEEYYDTTEEIRPGYFLKEVI